MILTDDVVAKTDWVKRLVGRPGVHVASGFRELIELVTFVQERTSRVEQALRSLVGAAA